MNIIFKLAVIITALMPDKTTQIVAGNDACIEDFPFIAEIQRREKRRDPWEHWCGAVILSETWLLTSAACFEGRIKNMRVRCGFDDLSDPKKQIRTIKRFTIHPRYNMNENFQFDNNIAVIKLRTPLKFGPRCRNISYTTIKGSDGLKNCQVSGWGFVDAKRTEADTLQFADISVLSNTKCNDLASPTVPKNQICAYDCKNIQQACNGDGGGPLTCERKGSRVLVGVFAWQYNVCNAEKPFVYSAVAYYTSLIEKWTGIKGIP
ncbi:plasma kallikrein-like [Mytilus californianus]|uniref:plasma kallikrein-like n=1 Tax=Mytilus californianus TaxID=6549 RepID=UPI0022464554|nr:plasma kallikrein-like [Mytilus californianus]